MRLRSPVGLAMRASREIIASSASANHAKRARAALERRLSTSRSNAMAGIPRSRRMKRMEPLCHRPGGALVGRSEVLAEVPPAARVRSYANAEMRELTLENVGAVSGGV